MYLYPYKSFFYSSFEHYNTDKFELPFEVKKVWAHGIGGETVGPKNIGGAINATLRVSSSATSSQAEDKEKVFVFELFNPDKQERFEEVVFSITASSNGTTIFQEKFVQATGKVILDVVPDRSMREITISKKASLKDSLAMQYGSAAEEAVLLQGPVFDDGGLYDFNVKVLSVGADIENPELPVVFNSSLTIPETTSYTVESSTINVLPVSDPIMDREENYDNDYKTKANFEVTTYYDKISDFSYQSGIVTLSMPFEWKKKVLDRIRVVHVEFHIPKHFSPMLAKDYFLFVNGIRVDPKVVSVDDYSLEEFRIVHTIIPKEDIESVFEQLKRDAKEGVGKMPNSIDYILISSKENFSLRYGGFAKGQGGNYKVAVGWVPHPMVRGQQSEVIFNIEKLYDNVTSNNNTSKNQNYTRKNISSELDYLFYVVNMISENTSRQVYSNTGSLHADFNMGSSSLKGGQKKSTSFTLSESFEVPRKAQKLKIILYVEDEDSNTKYRKISFVTENFYGNLEGSSIGNLGSEMFPVVIETRPSEVFNYSYPFHSSKPTNTNTLQKDGSIEDADSSQSYLLETRWFPAPLKTGEKTFFLLSMWNKTTGKRVNGSLEYDFVIEQHKGNMQNYGRAELLRESVSSGNNVELVDYTFEDKGMVHFSVKKVNGTKQTASFSQAVVPEFTNYGLMVALVIGASSALFLLQKRNCKDAIVNSG